jgi:hypothetical protein
MDMVISLMGPLWNKLTTTMLRPMHPESLELWKNNSAPNKLLTIQWNNISDAQKRHGSTAGFAGKMARQDQMPFWAYISSSAK